MVFIHKPVTVITLIQNTSFPFEKRFFLLFKFFNFVIFRFDQWTQIVWSFQSLKIFLICSLHSLLVSIFNHFLNIGCKEPSLLSNFYHFIVDFPLLQALLYLLISLIYIFNIAIVFLPCWFNGSSFAPSVSFTVTWFVLTDFSNNFPKCYWVIVTVI